jgi:hypothetical protein
MRRLFRFAAARMPRVSPTERIALRSGTVSVERDAFAGTLSARTLLDRYTPALPTTNDLTMLSTRVLRRCTRRTICISES